MQSDLARRGAETDNGILNAKLHLPEPRPEWIDRTELVGRLVDRHNGRLVLIIAPAGYGKSALISQWRADPRESRQFAYVALDHTDNDPVAMWTAIMTAVGRANPALDLHDLIIGLESDALDGVALPALLDRLGGLDRSTIIALDDLHMVGEPACHRQLALLLRYLPPTCQLVIASRTIPPVEVARLRASGDLLEVGMDDLRLTREELGTFVHHISRRTLAGADLAALADRTEGWPTGAYLAALSLRRHDSPGQLLDDLAASNRYILEYLSEEVLAGLSAELRRFLIRTSILERFTAPLSAAVAGTEHAGQLLEDLERASLFLIPLDDSRTWYRYHHLLTSFLRAQLAREEPDAEASLHLAASAWLERAGRIEDAIEHAFAAGDTERVIGLVAGQWLKYLNASRHATVQSWLARLGDQAISGNPVAAICAAWHAAFAGDRHAVRRWLATAEGLEHAGPLPDGTRSVASAAALIRASFGMEGLNQMLQSARVAVELETDPDSHWYGLARCVLGYNLYLAGQSQEAIRPLELAAQSQANIPLGRILTLSVLSLATGRLGRQAQARELAAVVRDLVRDHHLSESAQASVAFTAQGAVHARAGDLDAARDVLEHSLNLRRQVRGLAAWPTLDSLVLLANVALAREDPDTARALYDEAADLLAELPEDDGQVRADLATISQRLAEIGTATSGTLPLTKRELTVLRLLQGSLSITQIAGELSVSANTVKTHTRMIYQKLGVSSRREAVQRARTLGLL